MQHRSKRVVTALLGVAAAGFLMACTSVGVGISLPLPGGIHIGVGGQIPLPPPERGRTGEPGSATGPATPASAPASAPVSR